MILRRVTFALALATSCVDCSNVEPSGPTGDGDEALTAVAGDAPDGPPVRQPCTSSFGSSLSSGAFGRLDGILVAIVPPGGHACSGDAHHIHLQVLMQGAVYDVAVNVAGVDFARTDHARVGDAWSDGWHPGASLDYATALSIHSASFSPVGESELAANLAAALAQANHVSIFATRYSKGGAHLVHRNGRGNDGAIVIDPLSATPRYLLFHFPNQTF